MRKILYLSGTRADFGLLRSTLERANKTDTLDISICVTGTHLLPEYGNTITSVQESGLRICATIPVQLGGQSGLEMASALGIILPKLVETLSIEKPDMVLVLGDRGEMLVAALAAVHMNIPVVHIHGGERSGTIDESIRHAISKLSHYHFVATESAKKRLMSMGEKAEHIFVTGAPGLDDFYKFPLLDRLSLCRQIGFDSEQKIALLIYHPVVQEFEQIGNQMEIILKAISEFPLQVLCLLPNADAGGYAIRTVIEKHTSKLNMNIVTHLERRDFISWMNVADIMLGNSSAGIIEAASYGVPVINIGSRQNLRERNQNVMDVAIDKEAICKGIRHALKKGKFECFNIYGNGNASEHIVNLLEKLPLNTQLLQKENSY